MKCMLMCDYWYYSFMLRYIPKLIFMGDLNKEDSMQTFVYICVANGDPAITRRRVGITSTN